MRAPTDERVHAPRASSSWQDRLFVVPGDLTSPIAIDSPAGVAVRREPRADRRAASRGGERCRLGRAGVAAAAVARRCRGSRSRSAPSRRSRSRCPPRLARGAGRRAPGDVNAASAVRGVRERDRRHAASSCWSSRAPPAWSVRRRPGRRHHGRRAPAARDVRGARPGQRRREHRPGRRGAAAMTARAADAVPWRELNARWLAASLVRAPAPPAPARAATRDGTSRSVADWIVAGDAADGRVAEARRPELEQLDARVAEAAQARRRSRTGDGRRSARPRFASWPSWPAFRASRSELLLLAAAPSLDGAFAAGLRRGPRDAAARPRDAARWRSRCSPTRPIAAPRGRRLMPSRPLRRAATGRRCRPSPRAARCSAR